MTPLPTISIVTPSLNQAAYLEQTILSVKMQDYPGLEYRIQDGGSTDGSVDIIERHAKDLAGWKSEPDEGQADAIIRGFGECKGDVLAYLNSDDIYLPGALKAAGEAFAADPELDLLYGDVVFIDGDEKPLVVDILPRYNWEDLKRVCVIPQPAAFWRRRAYEAVGGIDASLQFSLDYDLFLRIAERGKVVHLPRLMSAFRVHPEAKSSVAKQQWAKEDRLLRRRYLGRDGWNRADWLRMKWLTLRQMGAILSMRLRGGPLPCLTPARWHRLARRRLEGHSTRS